MPVMMNDIRRAYLGLVAFLFTLSKASRRKSRAQLIKVVEAWRHVFVQVCVCVKNGANCYKGGETGGLCQSQSLPILFEYEGFPVTVSPEQHRGGQWRLSCTDYHITVPTVFLVVEEER